MITLVLSLSSVVAWFERARFIHDLQQYYGFAMSVLRKPKVWHRARYGGAFELSAIEQLHIKAALYLMRDRFGSWKEVAKILGCAKQTAKRAARPGNTEGKRPTGGMAIAIARAVGLPVEDLLAGKWVH